MNKKIMIFAFSLSWLNSLPAFAIQLQCATPESIEEGAAECSDNGKFGQAALNCLSGLEKAVQDRTDAAQKALAASSAAQDEAGNAQAHNFAGSGADYAISLAAMDDLLAAAKFARATTDSYLDHIYYPEDWDAPEEIIGDRNKFIEETECYADNANGIKNVVKKIDGYIAQFEKAKQASRARGTTSTGREGMQGSVAGVKTVTGGKAPPPAMQRVPAGRATSGVSDITGTREEKARRQK